MRVWLRRRRLSRYVEPLVALGVESLEDLLDVEPQHLQSIGMKVLQVERFLKVRPCGAAVAVTNERGVVKPGAVTPGVALPNDADKLLRRRRPWLYCACGARDNVA